MSAKTFRIGNWVIEIHSDGTAILESPTGDLFMRGEDATYTNGLADVGSLIPGRIARRVERELA